MFKASEKIDYPLKRKKFYKSISPFYFMERIFFSGEKLKNNPTSIYSFNLKNSKISLCLRPENSSRYVSPFLFKEKKEFYMLFENQNKQNKKTKLSLASSKNLKDWRIVIENFMVNENFNFGSPCLKKLKSKKYIMFYSSKKNKNKKIKYLELNNHLQRKKKQHTLFTNSNLNDYAPNLIKFKKNYNLFFSRWAGKIIRGDIFYSSSINLISWSNPKKIIFSNHQLNLTTHHSEPNLVKKKNKLYLYYEECDKRGKWKIAKTRLLVS